jgi:hypothetical protein
LAEPTRKGNSSELVLKPTQLKILFWMKEEKKRSLTEFVFSIYAMFIVVWYPSLIFKA